MNTVLKVAAVLASLGAAYAIGFDQGAKAMKRSRAVPVKIRVIDSSGKVIAEAERITREATDGAG